MLLLFFKFKFVIACQKVISDETGNNVQLFLYYIQRYFKFNFSNLIHCDTPSCTLVSLSPCICPIRILSLLFSDLNSILICLSIWFTSPNSFNYYWCPLVQGCLWMWSRLFLNGLKVSWILCKDWCHV